jgi:bacterioferritin (cytochrome b1)
LRSATFHSNGRPTGVGESDPTTRCMMESLLAEEEEHADDLNDLLGN